MDEDKGVIDFGPVEDDEDRPVLLGNKVGTGETFGPPVEGYDEYEPYDAFGGSVAEGGASAHQDMPPNWGTSAPPVDDKYKPLVDLAGKAADITKSAIDKGGSGKVGTGETFGPPNQPGYTPFVPQTVSSPSGGAGVAAVGVGLALAGLGIGFLLMKRKKRGK